MYSANLAISIFCTTMMHMNVSNISKSIMREYRNSAFFSRDEKELEAKQVMFTPVWSIDDLFNFIGFNFSHVSMTFSLICTEENECVDKKKNVVVQRMLNILGKKADQTMKLVADYVVNTKSIEKENIFALWTTIDSTIEQLKTIHRSRLREYSHNIFVSFNNEMIEIYEITNSLKMKK